MDYQKIYDSIINNAKSLNRKKGDDVYYESHHILPKCMGGGNEKENLVLLTAREHYVCHKILFWIYPHNNKLTLAYCSMTYIMRDKLKIKLTSREYEEIKTAYSLYFTGENHPMYNKHHNTETKEIMRQKKIGKKQSLEHIEKKSGKNNYNYGKTGEKSPNYGKNLPQSTKDKIGESKKRENLSPETIKKLSDSHSGENHPMFGKKHKPESIEKMRDKKLGKKLSPESIAKREATRKLLREERRMMIF
jgi:hypothetical protein